MATVQSEAPPDAGREDWIAFSTREMTDNPAARMMLGYLFVRGGVHALAYAKALEILTGVKMSEMLPIPNIGNKVLAVGAKFPAINGIINAVRRKKSKVSNAMQKTVS